VLAFEAADKTTQRQMAVDMLERHLRERFHQAGSTYDALVRILGGVRWRSKRKPDETMAFSWSNLPKGGCGFFFQDVLCAAMFIFLSFNVLWVNRVKLKDRGEADAQAIAPCLLSALARLQSCAPLQQQQQQLQ
jgi:hypothetical protein